MTIKIRKNSIKEYKKYEETPNEAETFYYEIIFGTFFPFDVRVILRHKPEANLNYRLEETKKERILFFV